jgi:hypothetical protein
MEIEAVIDFFLSLRMLGNHQIVKRKDDGDMLSKLCQGLRIGPNEIP